MSKQTPNPNQAAESPRRRARPDLTKPGPSLTAAPFAAPLAPVPIPRPAGLPSGEEAPGSAGGATTRPPAAVPAAFAGAPVFDPRAKLQSQALSRVAPATGTRTPLPAPASMSESTAAPVAGVSTSAHALPAKPAGFSPGLPAGKRAADPRSRSASNPIAPPAAPAVNPTPAPPAATTPAPFPKPTSLDAKAVFKPRELTVPAVRHRVFSNVGTKVTGEAGFVPPPGEPVEASETIAAPFLPEPKLPVINLTSPLPTAAELAKRTPPRAIKPATADAGEVVATVMQTSSKTPAMIRAFASVLKWAAVGAFLLIGGFYFTKNVLLPVLQEFKHPTTDGTVNPEAPTAVRVLQYTRKVVAENNAKVDKLNTIIIDAEKPGASMSGDSIATKPALPAAGSPAGTAAGGDERVRKVQRAVAEFKIGPVTGGNEPQVVLNGRLVKSGEMVLFNLGLRFVQVDEQARELHFLDTKAIVYRRPY